MYSSPTSSSSLSSSSSLTPKHSRLCLPLPHFFFYFFETSLYFNFCIIRGKQRMSKGGFVFFFFLLFLFLNVVLRQGIMCCVGMCIVFCVDRTDAPKIKKIKKNGSSWENVSDMWRETRNKRHVMYCTLPIPSHPSRPTHYIMSR